MRLILERLLIKGSIVVKKAYCDWAIAPVLETGVALYAERGDGSKLWASMVKQTLRRRRPDFSESSYGYKSFNDLIEDVAARDFMALTRDEKSGGCIIQEVQGPDR